MKFESFENARVVRSDWLEISGRRLDCNPYMSGGLEARAILENLEARKDRLDSLTLGIFHAGREGRKWVDGPTYGVPFLGSTDILAADLSMQPFMSKRQVAANPHFSLREKWTLITRSGSVGRMAYVRPDMAGMACSEHVMRVVPDETKISPGFLYAYLRSRFGVPLIVAGTYGAIIQHIEAEHIANLPVPRLGEEFESMVGQRVDDAANLLTSYQRAIEEATDEVFSAVGLRDITAEEWHSWGADKGFSVTSIEPPSLRALNFNPRFRRLISSIQSVSSKSLDEICIPGTLSRGGRFKRVDAAPGHAYQMIGQKELFWLKPEGRWIAKSALDIESLGVEGAVLVAAQGTLGESELYCRAEFVWGPWTEMAFSEHILRIIADESVMPRGYLFAFMRSETAFRMLRSISSGTKLQDHHYAFRGHLPVPYPEYGVQLEIHKKVVAAYEARHRAVALINEATSMVEEAIGGEAN